MGVGVRDGVEELLRLRPLLQRPQDAMKLAEKLLRVRGRDGALVPLRANAAQAVFEQARGRQNIILKARQMGMTSWVAGRFFLRTITARGVLTVQVAQTQEAAESLFGIVQRMWENLPASLREGPLRRSRANAERMVFPALDSEFRVASAGDVNAGRGLSVQNLLCSEVSRWPGDAVATLAGLRAALAPDGEITLESTANGAYGAFHAEWRREGAWQRHFFPWWMEPAYVGDWVGLEAMRAEERLLVAEHGLRGEQIGFRRGLERGFGGLRAQEFAEDAETCFLSSGDCCFDEEAIAARLREVEDAPLERRRGGALRVWLPALPWRKYIVAVDSAGGGSEGDFAAVQVVDGETGAQCAELQERLTPLELAREAAALAREYGQALMVVERNNHGSAVLAYLETVERYRHVYEEAGQAGWLTTAASKPEMVSVLGALLVESAGLFASERLLEECRTFVRGRHGSSAAAAGAHDDLVMAMAMAQAVRARKGEGVKR